MKRIGFMQGRLVNQVENKIQAFPFLEWEKEFAIAHKIGINIMEWTIDDHNLKENPLMSINGRDKIKQLCTKYNLKIPSLTADCVMQNPFWKTKKENIKELQLKFISLVKACYFADINIIVLPIIDNSKIENYLEESILRNFLINNENLFNRYKVKIAFESDMSPQNFLKFIDIFPKSCFGINYDIGNSASMGFNSREEIGMYGSRILNVHVKDRELNGITVPLGEGNANFKETFDELLVKNYSGNFILQTARSKDQNHASVLENYIKFISGFINKSFLKN